MFFLSSYVVFHITVKIRERMIKVIDVPFCVYLIPWPNKKPQIDKVFDMTSYKICVFPCYINRHCTSKVYNTTGVVPHTSIYL